MAGINISQMNSELAQDQGKTLMPDQYKPLQMAGQFVVQAVEEDPFNGAKRFRLILNGANVSSWSIKAPRKFDWTLLQGHSIELKKDAVLEKFSCRIIE